MTRTVGSRELKTRLGTYLRLVREGAILVVTDRGRPVAELRPIDSPSDDLEGILNEMVALGEASRMSCDPLERCEPASVRGRQVSDTVVEDRDNRF